MSKRKTAKDAAKKSDQPDKKKQTELSEKDLDAAAGGATISWGDGRGIKATGNAPRKDPYKN
jgi:hypothetical protein